MANSLSMLLKIRQCLQWQPRDLEEPTRGATRTQDRTQQPTYRPCGRHDLHRRHERHCGHLPCFPKFRHWLCWGQICPEGKRCCSSVQIADRTKADTIDALSSSLAAEAHEGRSYREASLLCRGSLWLGLSETGRHPFLPDVAPSWNFPELISNVPPIRLAHFQIVLSQ